VGVHHQTVQRCIERALAYGPLMALRPPQTGQGANDTPEAKAWLVSLACDKARITAIARVWTTRLLARHAREHGAAAGHGCLAKSCPRHGVQDSCQEEVKPHKVRYHLERRDAEFEQKRRRFCVLSRGPGLKKAAAKRRTRREKKSEKRASG